MEETIRRLIEESIRTNERILKTGTGRIKEAAAAVIASLSAGGKVLVFGNGGSAADSQHIAAELIGRFKKERKAIPAIALTTDTSILTALANDYGFDSIFSRQVEGLGRKGDVAIGISTSGNSKNVLEGIRKAKSMGLATICLVGGSGSLLIKECDISISVDSTDTPRIQESHTLIAHILCELVENSFS